MIEIPKEPLKLSNVEVYEGLRYALEANIGLRVGMLHNLWNTNGHEATVQWALEHPQELTQALFYGVELIRP